MKLILRKTKNIITYENFEFNHILIDKYMYYVWNQSRKICARLCKLPLYVYECRNVIKPNLYSPGKIVISPTLYTFSCPDSNWSFALSPIASLSFAPLVYYEIGPFLTKIGTFSREPKSTWGTVKSKIVSN